MPLSRMVAAYGTDAQAILVVLEHGETIDRAEGDAAIVCADLEEARRAHCQGTPRLASALLLAWRAGSALGAPGSLPPRHPSPAPTGCLGPRRRASATGALPSRQEARCWEVAPQGSCGWRSDRARGWLRCREAGAGGSQRCLALPVWPKYSNSPSYRRLLFYHRPPFGLSSIPLS